ncbi:hypothetical protein G6F65_015284 [Rhizopus arrhizus]|nr:hypothetical protein G6F65_015284 [Rhizopus arrhizus]
MQRSAATPAGLRAAPVALLRQTLVLAHSFDEAARQQRTVRLRGHAAEGNGASVLQTLADSVAASQRLQGAGEDIPATGSAVLGLSAPAGICQVAGQAIQLGVGHSTMLARGGSSSVTVAGHGRWQCRQAIGVLAGATRTPGSAGLSVVAGQQVLDMQAQADAVHLQARAGLVAASQHGEVQLAAGNTLHIATAGGASITLEDGHLRVSCPGTLTFKSGNRHFTGPVQELFPLPQFAQTVCVECLLKAMQAGLPWLPWQTPGDQRVDAQPACALLDMAFAPEAWTQLRALAADVVPLFTHRYTGKGLDRLSPCLAVLPDEARVRERCWQALLDLSNGAPMLSVLRSTADPRALAEHLRRIWEGCSSTGQPWLLRWADGRAAARLLDALDDAQRTRVLGGLHDWHLPTRIGDWMCAAHVHRGAGGHTTERKPGRCHHALHPAAARAAPGRHAALAGASLRGTRAGTRLP